MQSKEMLLRLWYHESCRVFQDRLVSEEDRQWFSSQLEEKISTVFQVAVLSICVGIDGSVLDIYVLWSVLICVYNVG